MQARVRSLPWQHWGTLRLQHVVDHIGAHGLEGLVLIGRYPEHFVEFELAFVVVLAEHRDGLPVGLLPDAIVHIALRSPEKKEGRKTRQR